MRLLIILSLFTSFGFAQNSVKVNQYYGLDSCKLQFKNSTGTGSFGLKGNDYSFTAPNGTYTLLSTLIANEPTYNTSADFEVISNVVAINNTAFYKRILTTRTFICNGVYMWLGGVASGTFEVALYNSAGTKIAGRAAVYDPSAVGLQDITWDTPVTLTTGTLYWFAIAGSNGAGDTWGLMPTSAINDSNYGFVKNSTTTVGASLPSADASTTYRFWTYFY